MYRETCSSVLYQEEDYSTVQLYLERKNLSGVSRFNGTWNGGIE